MQPSLLHSGVFEYITTTQPSYMTERLLQFIWQFQYYNKVNLVTEQGESLHIIHQGSLNSNQGPDFNNGRVEINNTTWAGNIELHLKSSDWHLHRHGADRNYHNIILHVVWQNDQEIVDGNGCLLPTLLLQPLVPKVLLSKYDWLMRSQDFVACEKQLPVLSGLSWLAWKERLAVERLQDKSAHVLQALQQANNHWEEVFWWMLARNFGIKVNADVFESLAKSIPLNVLAKHKNQIHQLEALLLGQAGLLQATFTEDYPLLLQREYRFLQKKYACTPPTMSPYFLRMRPANFPTIRLAQLAMLVYQSSHLFSKILEAGKLDDVRVLLNVTANDYWHYHYRFDDPVDYQPKQLGVQMVDNIIINTVVPVLFAYASHKKDGDCRDKTLAWLAELTPEVNTILKGWKSLGVSAANAMESQALIELKNNYCNKKRCLECAVGNALLRNEGGLNAQR